MPSSQTPYRPRIFIGSTVEGLPAAHAVQANLEHTAEVTIWHQGVFGPSEYPLDALESAARSSDAGVFLLTPDDVTRTRGRQHNTVRGNVILELGLFVGALGRLRSYIIAPRNAGIELPSDLGGLHPLEYNSGDSNLRAALGPACTAIQESVHARASNSPSAGCPLQRLAMFPAFDSTFSERIRAAQTICTFFIHARRWRDTHHESIIHALTSGARMTAFLPTPGDALLAGVFRRNFVDGPDIPGFLRDACRYYADLSSRFPGQITISFCSQFPVYSFYVLDQTVILALYTATPRKAAVPTLQVALSSPIGQFVARDISVMRRTCLKLSRAKVRALGSRKPQA